MGKQLLNIVGISTSSLQLNTFALILGVKNTQKRIPIIIGAYEAQAIAIELEGMHPSRPLTHDLVKSIFSEFDIVITEICINKFHEGVFYSLISFTNGIKKVEIDSRTSDAVALAVRYNCPIYALDEVIESTAMEDDSDFDYDSDETGNDLDYSMSIEELEVYLAELIAQENYEEASKIRDEIKSKKNK